MQNFYYLVAIFGSPLEPLTYHSNEVVEIGVEVKVSLRNRAHFGFIVKEVQEPSFQTQPLEKTSFYFDLKQQKLIEFISTYYVCSLGEAAKLLMPFSSKHQNSPIPQNIEKISLSTKQQEALEFLKQHPISLLFGDTGSGKTEIYMSYFEEVVQEGKQVIFLMPEIALTPQMQKRLEYYFKDEVVMWHSKLTPKQKKIAQEKIYNSQVKIVAGPRSALFLPLQNLGLIVVDEEHDDSYKSASRPRYHARDLAIYLAKLHNIPVVLGSATPSLSSYVKFPYFRLRGGHTLTQRDFIYEKSLDELSPFILQTLQETVQKKEQSIVFLPTRANFKYLICKDCGASVECKYCSIAMSVHQKSNMLKCHYCNYTQPIIQQCQKCGSPSLISSRIGTAQALIELQENLKDATIEQFDKDSISTNAKLKKLLKRFNAKEIDILVGTQMLSKGHDYENVTLAVVLGMDNILNINDYRSREKALSMLLQVAGRSGRKKDAKVIVQTLNEEFFEEYLDDYEKFLQDEKEYRVGLYPPYKKLCRVLFSHKNEQKAKQQMQQMQQNLQQFSEVEVVGAGACAIAKVANKFRFEILLRSNKTTEILKALYATKTPLAEIDIDPVEFH